MYSRMFQSHSVNYVNGASSNCLSLTTGKETALRQYRVGAAVLETIDTKHRA